MLSIYEYKDSRSFLRDAWEEKKKRNPAFSLRSWARRLGFENNSPLSLMLAGKRSIPRKHLSTLARDLELTSEEAFYLEVLNDFTNAKTPEEKERYASRLQSLAPHHEIRMTEVEIHKCLADPLHFIVLEMTDLKGFKSDPKWIQSHLLEKSSLAEIETALERLISLGLLKESATGKLKKTHSNVTNKWDVADKTVQSYHRNIAVLASNHIESTPVEEREYNSHSFNIETKNIPQAKARIQSFVRKFITDHEAKPGAGDQTYQMSVQLFPTTQNPQEDRK